MEWTKNCPLSNVFAQSGTESLADATTGLVFRGADGLRLSQQDGFQIRAEVRLADYSL